MQPVNSSSTKTWFLIITGTICILSALAVIVLMAVALPMMQHFRETARRESAALNLRSLESALRNYEASIVPRKLANVDEVQTVDAVRKIVSQHLGVDIHQITPSTSLADVGADELDLVELVMELEEHFSIGLADTSSPKLDGGISLSHPHGLAPMGELTMLKLAEIVDLQRIVAGTR
jgi:acyl carrier protein